MNHGLTLKIALARVDFLFLNCGTWYNGSGTGWYVFYHEPAGAV